VLIFCCFTWFPVYPFLSLPSSQLFPFAMPYHTLFVKSQIAPQPQHPRR
jgi:hypothetical protein